MVKQSHISLKMHDISIHMVYSSDSKRLRSYTLSGSIPCWGDANEMHLIDSPLHMCEAKQNPALNNFVSMIMVFHVEMDLMELPI